MLYYRWATGVSPLLVTNIVYINSIVDTIIAQGGATLLSLNVCDANQKSMHY